MRLKKAMSFILALVFMFSALQIFSFAEESEACTHNGGEITVIVPDSASEEAEAKIHAHFCGECNEAAADARGLTCTLFGHDIESGSSKTITHKVRTTSPRCLQETYTYEICSRCDYESYALISSSYIVCCS
ncbi:MAG: hypothetical protein IJE74_00440 [Clostridia bacterium]|nr:hypothetical protein [Clostridia bacterium]